MLGLFLTIAAGILTSNKGKSSADDTKPANAGGGSGGGGGVSVPGATEGPQGYGVYTHTPSSSYTASGWAYKNVTRSRETYTGFEDISICRPRFIFFKVSGLRPNTRHFVFFDKINVTNYVNTDSFTYAQRETLSRNSVLRNPGEKYVGETGFPAEQGGPTSVIRSDDAGEIEGCFYLQSNGDLNFPAGNRQMVFLDISAYKPLEAISYATTSFTVDGGIEDYLRTYYTERVRYWDTWTVTVPASTSFTAVEKPKPAIETTVPKTDTTSPAVVKTTRSNDDDSPKMTHHSNGDISFEYDYGTVTHKKGGGVEKDYL